MNHINHVVLFATIHALVSCTSLTPQEKTQAADTAYFGEMVKCVDDAMTIEQSKACRSRVRAAWHVVDGGVAK